MNGAQANQALLEKQTSAGISVSRLKISTCISAFPKLLFIFFLMTLPLVNPWIRGDGVGYYSYLRSILIDHDLNFENDYLAGNESFIMGLRTPDGHLIPQMYTKTGRVQNHFTVGPAILWAPALVAVHVTVVGLNHLGMHIPADGLSRPYIIGMAVTTACYGFLSLLLGFRIACKYIDEKWALLATIGAWFASSLPVYMYFNPSWSHALSAFTVALFLWYWDDTQLRRTLGQWIVLGLLAGLMGNVYYPNVFLLLFPALEILFLVRAGIRSSGGPPTSLGDVLSNAAIFAGTFLLALLPTFITRQIIYGSVFSTGYPGVETWHWTSPAFLPVLFSADHGMWSWTPILFLAVVGFPFLYRRNTLLGAGAILTFLAYYYFIASYPDWDGLSSYGNRFFVSLTPIFLLGLAALLDAFSKIVVKKSRALILSSTAIALLTVWNAGFIFQWGTHLVPARGEISWSRMVHNQFVVVPAKFKYSLETYFLHRSDMMQHIEEEDIQQRKAQQFPED